MKHNKKPISLERLFEIRTEIEGFAEELDASDESYWVKPSFDTVVSYLNNEMRMILFNEYEAGRSNR